MADKTDGRIVIETRLDTPEMKEDTNFCNELLKSVIRTATALHDKLRGLFKDTIKPVTKADEAAPSEEAAKRIEDMRGQLEEMSKQKVLSPEFKKMETEAAALSEKIKELEAEKKAALALPEDQRNARLKYLNGELDETKRAYVALIQSKEQLERTGGSYIDPRTTEEYKALAAAIRNAEEEMNRAPATDTIEAESAELREAERTAQRLTVEMGRLGAASEQGFRNPEQVLRFSANVREAEQSIQNAREQLEALAEQQIPTEDYAGLTKAIELSDQALAKLYQKREQLRGEGLGEESAKWQKLAEQISAAEQEAEYLAEKKRDMESSGAAFISPESTAQYKALEQSIQGAEQRLETSKGLINQEAIEQARLNVLIAQEKVATAQSAAERERALQELRAAQNALAAIAGKSVTPKPDADALDGWDALKAKVRNAESAVIKAFGSGTSKLFSGLKNGLKQAGSWFKGLVSHAKSAGLSANGLAKSLLSVKNMLLGRIKSTFVSFLTNAIKEGINGLAQYSSAVDGAISRLRNSTKEIGANLAVTLGNILTTIEPIITGVLNAVSTAVTKVNALIAMLRGQSTMTVAKKRTDSYAASLDGTASKTKKAADAQKKYNAQLMGFDQLNKLSAPNENENSGSGGSDLFTDVPTVSVLKDIPDELEDIVKRIKDAAKAGDWRGVGRAIGDGLNMAVGAFDNFINKVRPKALAAAQALGEGITGFLEAADTGKAGATLANGLNLITQTIHRFITATDWGLAGKRLGEGINGLALGIDWKEAAETVADGFNGLVDFVYNTVTTIKWNEIAAKLSKGVNSLVERVDWKKAGQTIGEAAKGVLRFLVTALEEIDWWAVGQAIADLVLGVDWGGVADALFEGLGAAVAGVLNLLGGLADRLMTALYDAIIDVGKSLGWNIEGENIVWGLIEGMLSALVGIGQWIIDHIFKPIWNGIKKAFGIASPSKETETLGEYIIDGLLQGILSGLGAILDFFKGLVKAIAGVLVGAWNGIKAVASTAWSAISGVLTSAWNGIKGAAETIWNGAKGIAGKISDGIQNIQSRIANSKLYQAGAEAMESLRKTCSEKWETVKNTIGDAWDGLRGFLSKKDGLVQAGKDLLEGLKGGIQKGWAAVKETVGGVWDKVVSGAKSAFGVNSPSKVFAEIGGYLDEGLAQGIQKEKPVALKATAQLAQAVSETMSAEIEPPPVKLAVDDSALDTQMQRAYKVTAEVEPAELKDKIKVETEVQPVELEATLALTPDKQAMRELAQPVVLDVDDRKLRQPLPPLRAEIDGDEIERTTASIQDRLHDLPGIFDGIVDRLAAIAEAFAGVQFAMPDIATGAVIPPRVRVTDAVTDRPAAIAESGTLERKLDQLLELLTTQQTRGQAVQITVPVQLDRTQLGKAVASYNLSGQRITNGGLR